MEKFNVANFETEEPILTSVYPEKVAEPEDSLLFNHLADHGMDEVDVPTRKVEQEDNVVRHRKFQVPRMNNQNKQSIPMIEMTESPMMPFPEPFKHTFVSLIHTILAIFALYLSFICNKGFDLASFLAATFCPYVYILYVFAIRPDLCGLRS